MVYGQNLSIDQKFAQAEEALILSNLTPEERDTWEGWDGSIGTSQPTESDAILQTTAYGTHKQNRFLWTKHRWPKQQTDSQEDRRPKELRLTGKPQPTAYDIVVHELGTLPFSHPGFGYSH